MRSLHWIELAKRVDSLTPLQKGNSTGESPVKWKGKKHYFSSALLCLFWNYVLCFNALNFLHIWLHFSRRVVICRGHAPCRQSTSVNFRISPYGEQSKAPRLLESCHSVVRSRNLNTVKPLQARSRGNKWFKTQMNKLQWSPYPEETRTELWSLVLLAGWMLTWGPFKEAQALFIRHETAVES